LSIFEQTLGALTIIKSYNAQQLFSDKFKVLNEYAQKIFNKQNRYYSIAWPSADFSMTLVIVIMLCVGGKLILTGQSDINPATFIGFLVVFYSIISPLRDIMKCSFGIRKAMASVSRLNKILKIEEELDNKVNSKHLSTENISSILKIENLSFGYSSEEQTLNDINIEINSSEKIAIIGETGSGKSTLIHLINRLYDNYDGNIFLQGVDIKKLPRANSRRKIAYVPQKPMLFNDTILDNITLKDDNITIDKVVSVTKKIGIHDFIVSLPEKYNTIIGDQGCSISGGQQQCISIARAMVRESSILIIDEGTSALDPKLESTILNDLIYKEDNKTVIIVTHKISSVLNVDRIFVIKNGKVIENGTPKELYQKGGVFRNLALYQNVTL
jgi:ABC-type multidrug transport system fused ATPase/permease subunit